MRLIPVPVSLLDNFWPLCEPLLEPAIAVSHGMFDAARVYYGIKDGSYLLFVKGEKRVEMALVAEITQGSRARSFTVLFVGGEAGTPEDIHQMVEEVRTFAVLSNCTQVSMVGRPGWKRYFPDADHQLFIIEDIKGIPEPERTRETYTSPFTDDRV